MRPRDLAALLSLAAIWGGSYLFIRIAAPVLGPVLLAEVRVAVAGLALLAYAVAVRQRVGLRERWRQYLVVGIVNAVLPYALIATAELHLTAGFASILNGTTPMFTALVAAVWIGDPLTARKVLGMVLGIVGVTVLVGWSPLPLDATVLLSAGAALLAALFYGIGSTYARRAFVGVPPLASATGQQLGAAAGLLPFALPIAVTAGTAQPLTMPVALAVLALALICTSVAYLLYFSLITNVGPTSTTTVTLLIPIFSLLWSGIFLNEQITPGMIVGLLIILSSVTLITGLRIPLGRRRAAPQSIAAGQTGDRVA